MQKSTYVDAITQHLYGTIPSSKCINDYLTLFQDPDFIRCFGVQFSSERIHQILEKDTTHWNRYGWGPLVWFDKNTHAFVGRGGLNHTVIDSIEAIELAYALTPQYWGKGLAVEIGQYAIDAAFKTLKLDQIVCFTLVNNQRSLRVIEKLGFKTIKPIIHAELPHQLYQMKNPTHA